MKRRNSKTELTIELADLQKTKNLKKEDNLNFLQNFPIIFSSIVENKTSLSDLRINDSRKKIKWSCKKSHIWEDTAINRIRRRDCPVCVYIILVPGVNDLKTLYPDISDEFDTVKNEFMPEYICPKPSLKIWWKCLLNHSYLSSIGNRVFGIGCPFCSSRRILSGFNDFETLKPEKSKEFNIERNEITPDKIFSSSNTKYWWICLEGHEYFVSPNSIGVSSCKICNNFELLTGFNDLGFKYPALAIEFDEEKNGVSASNVMASHGAYWWKCEENHSWKAEVGSRIKGAGCILCNCKASLGVNDLKTFYPELARMYVLDQAIPLNELRYTSKRIVNWQCKDGHIFTVCPSTLVERNGVCIICRPNNAFRSSLEKSIFDVLKELINESEIIVNTRKIISPKELDFYFPLKRKAIEANGNYWHKEKLINSGVDPNEHHRKKFNLCEKKGIELLYIWEDEWKHNQTETIAKIEDFLSRPWGWYYV